MVFASPVPQISISPPEEPVAVESFQSIPWSSTLDDSDNDFRPKHLTPPPTHLKFVGGVRPLSPLRPSDSAATGLERDRFEALLRASRERNNAARKDGDLRKEIALKTHKNKQVQRRALFLSKVLAPPSPTATSLPKTPPDSPAMFHWSLPSPGLESPLALFESLSDKTPTTWVEQVDFRLPAKSSPSVQPTINAPRYFTTTKTLPSLDEISARMSNVAPAAGQRLTRLPAFLARQRPVEAAPERAPRLTVGVGRLQMPVRAQTPKVPRLNLQPPKSPVSPVLEVTAMRVPRSATLSPTELSESNILALESRERRAQDMLSTLRKRMVPSDTGLNGHDDAFSEDRRSRRQSAPAELINRPRTGFEHPVLALPGGF